jgi:precorrin-2/cobalt-factor-2 C20-methyltransferase
LAREIVTPHLEGRKTPLLGEVAMRMPMVEARFPAQDVYDQAAIEIGDYLKAGHDVAVLCEGDPFFYGSFMYLYARMIADYKVEVIPGVSSLNASSAASGIPLVTRNEVLTIIPAPLPDADIKARLENAQVCVIMKIGRHFDKVFNLLDEMDLVDQAHFIAHASMDQEITCPLGDMRGKTAPYFSMILVHKSNSDERREGKLS